MQLYREITEYRAGEGESYIEIRQDGKRCVVIEKKIGIGRATRTDIDANGAAYAIVQRLDLVGKLTSREKQDWGLYGGRDEPSVHPQIQAVFNENPRVQWSPLAARVIWAMCHGRQEAA